MGAKNPTFLLTRGKIIKYQSTFFTFEDFYFVEVQVHGNRVIAMDYRDILHFLLNKSKHHMCKVKF